MSDLRESRRRFFLATAAGFFGVSAGAIAWGRDGVGRVSSSPGDGVPIGPEAIKREMLSQRKKLEKELRERHHIAISQMRKTGKPFSLPRVSTLRDSVFGGIWFSPDGNQSAIVAGNMTQQEIHVAKVSAGTLSSNRLLTRFSNCFRVTGLSWEPTGTGDILCRCLDLNRKKALRATNEHSLRRLVKEEGIRITIDDFAGALEIVSPNGRRKQVRRLPAYDPDSLDTATAWNAPESVLVLEKNKLTLCSPRRGSEPKTCYTGASPSSNGEFSKLRQVAWDAASERFVVLEYRRKFTLSRTCYDSYALMFFDPHGKKVGEIQEVEAFKKHRGASLVEVIESPNGRYLAGLASYDGRSKTTEGKQLLVGCDLLTGKVVERALPSGIGLRCLSVTPYGDALLAYSARDPLGEKGPGWESMEMRAVSIT